jgi:protein-disulfide isomerase
VTGKVKEVVLQFLNESLHPQALKAGEASLCAAKRGAEAYWAMHDRLFAGIDEWSGKENAVEVFKGYASELGLDAAAFASCLDSGEMAAEVEAQAQEGVNRGARSIPTFFINDWTVAGTGEFESMFRPVIEKALSGQHPPPTPTPLPEGKTFTDPNPERPGYTYGGDAFRGSDTAQVLLFEFVNFGSAENRKVALETWPELQQKYVDSGKVRFMVKHLPTSDQPATVQAAEAAECAGQQNAFWEMHDLLFQRQEE